MKKLNLFEWSVIGLLVGVVVSTYVTFLSGTDGFIGKIISSVSLLPILRLMDIPMLGNVFVVPFLFVVLVFTVYAVIVGTIVRRSSKVSVGIVAVVVIIIAATFYEQKNGATLKRLADGANTTMVATVIKTVPKIPDQYFDEGEAVGDLNGDGKEDIAFLLPRDDGAENNIYYLTASLKTDGGHVGTNLIFLGGKVEPKNLSIVDGIINIEYMDRLDKKATTTKEIYAQVVDGKLVDKP